MTLSQKAVEAAVKAYAHEYGLVLGSNGVDWDGVETGLRAALTAALAVDGLCLVPKEELAVVLYAASLHDDEGPAGEGWQSTALEYACENVEMCVAAANDGEERSSPPEGKI